VNPLGWAAFAGIVVAGGVLLVGYGLAPVYPSLGDALRRLDPVTARQLPGGSSVGLSVGEDNDDDAADAAGWQARLRGQLAARVAGIPGLSVPTANLNLLARSTESFLLAKVGFAVAGLAVAPLFVGLLALNGITFPVVVPAAVCLAAAAGGFFLPDRDIAVRARRARGAIRQALCAYLDLAALAKAANYGAVDALTHAAATGHGWAFARLRDAITWAEQHQAPPWVGLQRLAEQADIEEMADIAAIGRTSADGAAVFTTLLARSASLRSALASEATGRANRASEQMTLPVIALAFGFLALMMFAAIARVVGL